MSDEKRERDAARPKPGTAAKGSDGMSAPDRLVVTDGLSPELSVTAEPAPDAPVSTESAGAESAVRNADVTGSVVAGAPAADVLDAGPAGVPAADAEGRGAATREAVPAAAGESPGALGALFEGGPAEEPADIRAAREVIVALDKAMKAANMYPANNPVHARFLADFREKLTTFFAAYDALRIVIGQNRLIYQGEVVYEGEHNQESLPRRLFRDGIREMTFHAGFTEEEAKDVLALLARGLDQADSSDDVVTLLWDRHFEHLTYTAIDDFLEYEMTEGDVPGEEFQTEFAHTVQLEIDKALYEDQGALVEEARRTVEELKKKVDEGTDEPSVYSLSPAEQAELNALLEGETDETIVIRGIDILFELLAMKRGDEVAAEVAQVLEGAFEVFLSQLQFARAAAILDNARELAGPESPFRLPEQREAFASLYRRAGEPRNLAPVRRAFDGDDERVETAAIQYLRRLPPEAIAPIVDVLGELDSAKNRRTLVDALVEIAKGKANLLAPKVEDPRWYVVRNVVLVLGKTEDMNALQPLRKALNHTDVRVRKEVVRALSQFDDDRARDTLVRALSDPDVAIRLAAARILASVRYAKARDALLQMILERNFEARPLPEKRGIFRALGLSRDARLAIFLRQILERKTFFPSQENDEMRACAAEALGLLGSEDSRRILLSFANDKRKLVAAAVESALRPETAREREREAA